MSQEEYKLESWEGNVTSSVVACNKCGVVVFTGKAKVVDTDRGKVYFCGRCKPKYDREEGCQIFDAISQTLRTSKRRYFKTVEVDEKGKILNKGRNNN